MASVGELMNRSTLHTVADTVTVAEAATVMSRARVGSTLVMEGDRLIGIFTERDMVRAISQAPESAGDPIAHWMTRSPQVVTPETDAQQALDAMVAGGFRHLPVVEGVRVIGVISMRDLAATGLGVPAHSPRY
ncbi:MAG: CBS domain-containing protein [Candidatus Dormibacteraeota bacterium]|uniref:CBS domain-containing protein n=1 Tax=Candidatus Dormiibacter inghamiae TaxID=3127013 RepID=A0A934KB42_9BACT|nr:CBS domain-containing protein [Candidatus Dormibacteraeota bacterium]MBJ7606822.1 CBS domain-containing protein [Candidatus Dormibacteraeota bacterium]